MFRLSLYICEEPFESMVDSRTVLLDLMLWLIINIDMRLAMKMAVPLCRDLTSGRQIRLLWYHLYNSRINKVII